MSPVAALGCAFILPYQKCLTDPRSGLMIAKGFAANGAKVYITGRREETLRAAAASLPEKEGILIPYVTFPLQYNQSNTSD